MGEGTLDNETIRMERMPSEKVKIPKYGSTDDIPFDDKVIYEHWFLPSANFHWLIAEYDPKTKIAFGYANLNNDQNAEWGDISIDELIMNGAERDRYWKPVPFPEAKKIVGIEQRERG